MRLQKDIPELEGKTVIFFDGICDLCNGMVQFVIKRDKDKRFHFASLQSDLGRQVLQALPPEQKNIDSILLYKNGELDVESAAAIKIMSMLPGVWGVAKILLAVPAVVRNIVYRIIARNRYRWFGKAEQCMIPTPELRERFLD